MGKKIILFFTILVIFIVSCLIMWRGTYSIDKDNTYTRSELQELIVSTGLSYYYNNEYSDYEQYSMDEDRGDNDYTSFFWRSVNNSPEMVNRANEYNIDCSSFILMTYLNSIGYDMKEYYANDEYEKYFNNIMMFDNFSWVGSRNGYEYYRRAYFQFGKAFSTGLIAFADVVSGHNGLVGDEYINDGDSNTSSIVYHYRVDLNDDYSYGESSTKINEIRNNIISILEPGDALVYRRKVKSTGGETGHITLYIGDALKEGDYGFIHATGVDFSANSSEIVLGNDDYAIRYDTWDVLFKNHIFVDSATLASYEFAIIRPINTYCESGKDSCNIDVDSNVIARNELSRLRIEQYQNTPEEDDVSIVSKYNSVNNGDSVKYNLILNNKSKFEYCSGGGYLTKEKCEEANRKWISTDQEEITYSDLKVIGEIPDGTTYVECTNGCSYDKNNNIVTWNVSDISSGEEEQLSYTVMVNTDEDIKNSGMEIITSSGNTLLLGELTTKVNPTINNDIDKDVISENVEKFRNLALDGKIIYNSSTSGSNYKLDLDEITSTEISKLGFIKSIYYNSFGMDLNFLTTPNIKGAIFNSEIDAEVNQNLGVFGKKSDALVSNLIENGMYSLDYQKINKMLVKGMYGGRLLKGDDNEDRARFLKPSYLDFGDIIIAFSKDMASINAYLFLGFDDNGNSIFVEYNKNSDGVGEIFIYDVNKSGGKTGYRIFRELYAKGLFVVLRPTQLYGTTINYDYNGGSGDVDSYVAYDIYNNLVEPTRDGYVFDGWYSNSDLTERVNNDSKILSFESYTLYAKWKLVNQFKFDSDLNVDEDKKYINYSSADVMVSELIEKVSVIGGNIEIKDIDGNVKNDSDLLATGDIFMFYVDDVMMDKYEISILGDVNGDGKVTVNDVSKLFQNYRGTIEMDDIYVSASDVVVDNDIKLTDVAKLFQYVRKKISSLE